MEEFLIPKSFRCLIIGPSGCGKTHLLMKIINSDMVDYDRLCLIGRSLHQDYYQILQKCYEENIPKNVIFNIFERIWSGQPPDIDELIDMVVNDVGFEPSEVDFEVIEDLQELPDPGDLGGFSPDGGQTLVVMDDLLDEKQSQLSKYFTRGRHNKINTFYISQSYFHLPRKTIRMNSNFLILFKLPLRDVQDIYHDLVGMDMNIQEFKQLCNLAWSKSFCFLIIDLTKNRNNGKYRLNFHDVYIPKTNPY